MTQPRLLGGRYELGELIGYGGMAEVHRGRDVRLGRDVAIKVLRPDLARDPSFLNRFRREAQSAAGLNHPSIVSVYDTGEDVGPEGTTQPYIVMEFVEGRTLRDILKAEGRLPVRRAMEITADVSAALDFSHRAGLVHRDVKPANVMITQAGAVKVMDFGIARALADNSSTVTQTANVIGTAQYLSPEQARGEAVDARSDVYSTGCLLYELVTGVPPFQGDSPVAVAYQHVRENASAPSSRVANLPRAVDSIVMKALAKNPQNRYQSAAEMRTDLQRALADQPVSAESVMTDAERTQFIARTPVVPLAVPRRDLEPDPEPERRSGWIWVAIVVALLLVIGAGGFFIWKLGDSKDAVKTVAVPDLVGKTLAQANTELHNTPGCADTNTCKVPLSPSPDGATTPGPCDDGQVVKEGLICKVFTQASTKVEPGSEINEGTPLYFQTYKKAVVSVPYVKGLSFSDAQKALAAAHLKFKRGKDVDTFSVTKNDVVDQKPEENQNVSPGSVVTLYLSSGKAKLPDVRKKKADDAQRTLNIAQFTNIPVPFQTITTHDKSKDNTVASESPTPGVTYPADQKITLVVYKYKPLPPTCDPAKTPTPTAPPPSSTGAPSSGLPSGLPTGLPSASSSASSSTSSSPSSSPTNTLPACGQH